MWVHVYVNSSRDLPSIKAAVEDHGCEVKELEPALYDVRVHDPTGDAEDEVTEYLNDAGIEAEVSFENPLNVGKPKAYDLLICGNLLSVVVNGKSGTIEQGLPRETCPSCDQADCCNQCDGSQGADNNEESEEDANDRTRYNAVLDAVESIILAHACAGIKVDDPKYIEGIETTLEAAGNALGDLAAEGAAPTPNIDAEIAKAEKGDTQALAFLYDHYSKTSHGLNCSYRCKGECDCEKADIAQVLEANGRDVP